MPVVRSDDVQKANRDKVLDQLKEANDAYYEKELKRIQAEEDFYREVLKARGGARSLAKANAAASKLLLANDIGSFLAG